MPQIIELCSFVGFFAGFNSLDTRSLKADYISAKAKCHFSASPILLLLHEGEKNTRRGVELCLFFLLFKLTLKSRVC